jgi:hypothetical protein
MSTLEIDARAQSSAAAIKNPAAATPIPIPHQVSALTAFTPFLSLDGVVDLQTVDRGVFRRVDSDSHLVTSHVHDRDADVVSNDDHLVSMP